MQENEATGTQSGKRKRAREDRALPSARHELWDDSQTVQVPQQTIMTAMPRGLRGLGTNSARSPV